MGKEINTKLVKRTINDWGKVLILLLDDAAVVVIVIVVLRFLGISIPWPVTIALALVLGILVFAVHMVVIPSFHRRIVTGAEGMPGTEGRVVKSLNPVGSIIVKGEHWKATSVEDNIDVDEDVEIVGIDGLMLKVRRIDG